MHWYPALLRMKLTIILTLKFIFFAMFVNGIIHTYQYIIHNSVWYTWCTIYRSGINDEQYSCLDPLYTMPIVWFVSMHKTIFMSGIHETLYLCPITIHNFLGLVSTMHNFCGWHPRCTRYFWLLSMVHDIYVWYLWYIKIVLGSRLWFYVL